jgi:SAM-dependent methyltransferase
VKQLLTASVQQSYDSVADEYYDPERHPTCFNFGELSGRFILPRLAHNLAARKAVLEVGAGRSIIAPVMARAGALLNQLVLLDSSKAMLSYSQEWEHQGAKLLITDARLTRLLGGSFDIIVSSLGDPYNCPRFWLEVERLLRPSGICLFTSPAFEWACRFRRRDSLEHAEFLVSGGKIVNVPSHVPPLDEQLKMISEARLSIREIVAFYRTDLHSRPSPKLDVFNEVPNPPVVRGFMVEKISFASGT